MHHAHGSRDRQGSQPEPEVHQDCRKDNRCETQASPKRRATPPMQPASPHIRGKNTIGYGKTKAVCIEGAKQNMSIEEVAQKHGLTIAAVRSCSIRNGIKLRNTSGRVGWGKVKDAIIEGIRLGLTLDQVAKKFRLKRHSIQRTCLAYKLELKK